MARFRFFGFFDDSTGGAIELTGLTVMDNGAASATGDRGAASMTEGAASATGYRGAASATGQLLGPTERRVGE